MLKVRSGTRYKRVIEPFEEMYLARLSTRDIAKLLNVASSKVAKVVKELNISRNHNTSAALASYKWSKSTSNHPRTSRLHARQKVESKLSRKLSPYEHVHHKDEDFTNNNDDNLEVKGASQHVREHNLKYTDTQRRELKALHNARYRKANAHKWRKGGKYYAN